MGAKRRRIEAVLAAVPDLATERVQQAVAKANEPAGSF